MQFVVHTKTEQDRDHVRAQLREALTGPFTYDNKDRLQMGKTTFYFKPSCKRSAEAEEDDPCTVNILVDATHMPPEFLDDMFYRLTCVTVPTEDVIAALYSEDTEERKFMGRLLESSVEMVKGAISDYIADFKGSN